MSNVTNNVLAIHSAFNSGTRTVDFSTLTHSEQGPQPTNFGTDSTIWHYSDTMTAPDGTKYVVIFGFGEEAQAAAGYGEESEGDESNLPWDADHVVRITDDQ